MDPLRDGLVECVMCGNAPMKFDRHELDASNTKELANGRVAWLVYKCSACDAKVRVMEYGIKEL